MQAGTVSLFLLIVVAAQAIPATVISAVALKNTQSPGSKTITVIPKGATVELISKQTPLSRVQYRGTYGYALSRCLSTTKDPIESKLAGFTDTYQISLLLESKSDASPNVTSTNPATTYTTAAPATRGTAIIKDIASALSYAKKYYKKPNHICDSPYKFTKDTFAYFGNTACGYESHGGDGANFVSQILIAGGHMPLTRGVCRGKSYNGAEPGTEKLYSCLTKNFGWKSSGCSRSCKAPQNVAIGDLVVFYKTSCTKRPMQIAFVNRVSNGMAYITSHSKDYYDKKYTYNLYEMPYCEFLLRKL